MSDQTPQNLEARDGELVDTKLTAETTISPKVVASAATGLALVVVIAVLTAVTPEMLEPLGPWASLVYAAVVALGTGLAGYVKRDPLREV